MKRVFRKPIGLFISADAKKLYRIEERRNKVIEENAKELQEVLVLADFWLEAMPETLLSILTSYETGASVAAATAFLESKGFTVNKD